MDFVDMLRKRKAPLYNEELNTEQSES